MLESLTSTVRDRVSDSLSDQQINKGHLKDVAPGENTTSRLVHSSASEEAPRPSRRLVPPPRIVPQVPEEEAVEEEEEEADQEAYETQAQSHLFIPPPKERTASHINQGNVQDEDDGAGNGSDDALPLPVPHRWSAEVHPAKSDPQSDDSLEADSDHDGQPLPVPPRPAQPPRVISPEGQSQSGGKVDVGSPNTWVPLNTEVMDEDEGGR